LGKKGERPVQSREILPSGNRRYAQQKQEKREAFSRAAIADFLGRTIARGKRVKRKKGESLYSASGGRGVGARKPDPAEKGGALGAARDKKVRQSQNS